MSESLPFFTLVPCTCTVSDDSCGGGGGGGNGCTSGAGSGLPSAPRLAQIFVTKDCQCIAGEQELKFADGEVRSAATVQVGDTILGLSKDGERRVQTIVSVSKSIQPCVEIANSSGKLLCSASHYVVAQGWVEVLASGLCPDELTLIADDGSQASILSIRPMGAKEVVSITCVPDHVFFAGGVLNHNKTQTVDDSILEL